MTVGAEAVLELELLDELLDVVLELLVLLLVFRIMLVWPERERKNIEANLL